jgi:hypothetical protein
VLPCTSTVLSCTSTVLSCTSPVLSLYFGSTVVSPFLPSLDFNIIGKIDSIYIRKKFLNIKYNIDD